MVGNVDEFAFSQHMREVSERRAQLERDHADALAELRRHQKEIQSLPYSSEEDKRRKLDLVKTLESKVRELDKKCELQNVLHEELVLEMSALKKLHAKRAWTQHRSMSAEEFQLESDPLFRSSPDPLSRRPAWQDSDFEYGHVYPSVSSASSLPSLGGGAPPAYRSTAYQSPYSLPNNLKSKSVTLSSEAGLGERAGGGASTLSSGLGSNTCLLSSSRPSSNLSNFFDNTSAEMEKIMMKIERDNRLLAELEKSRATIGSPVSIANMERVRAQIERDCNSQANMAFPRSNLKLSFSSPAIDQLMLESQRTRQTNYHQLSQFRSPRSTLTLQHLDLLMKKLEQDNRILAELDKKRTAIGSSSRLLPSISSFQSGGISSSFQQQQHGGGGRLGGLPIGVVPSIAVEPSHQRYGRPEPGYKYQRTDSDQYGGVLGSLADEEAIKSEVVDYIELPGRGKCRVYIARYSYDPMKQSPNENPEAELFLNAGDYILICSEMDEDGYFQGELMDGRKGLVPSNFIEKLTGDDLFDFQATVLYGNRDSDDSSASYTYGADLDLPLNEDFQAIPPEDFHRMNDYIDLEDIEEVDEDDISEADRDNEGPVPPPNRLILERQLNKSILIGWLPADDPRDIVESYQVYVDGVIKATVRVSDRTRALVEGVDSSQPHRISVRSVSYSGNHSRDAACTIVIGKDVPLAPSCVKATQMTATSAMISWLPSNSNFHHVVAVNNVEVKSLKSGVFRHTIKGLTPNTMYRVSVRAKPGKLLYNDEKNPRKLEMLTGFVDFRTLPKGIPDPPVDIQVESGPQDGTLLVTWMPVKNSDDNEPNDTTSAISGYAVFAGGRKIVEVNSPTGDHALLDISEIERLPKKSVTVRTKSGDGMSSDSLPCAIPEELYKGIARSSKSKSGGGRSGHQSHVMGESRRELSHDGLELESSENPGSVTDSESDTELAELIDHVTRRTRDFDPAEFSPYEDQDLALREDSQVDSTSRSELSDIQEEGEHSGEHDYASHHEMKDSSHPSDRSRHSNRHQSKNVVSSSSRNLSSRDKVKGHGGLTRDDLPSHRRVSNIRERRNSAGQLIIEHDENLSDKEIYPQSLGGIPAIEITKDSASEECNSLDNFSEDDYELGRRTKDQYGTSSSRGYKGRGVYHQAGKSNERQLYRPQSPSRAYDEATSHAGRQTAGVIELYNSTADGAPYANGVYGPARSGGVSKSGRSFESFQEGRFRWFVALFDYDPKTMSPNPDAAEEELPFQEGQLIKIYGDKDADGFYRGESQGRIGYVPCNMVSEVQVENEEQMGGHHHVHQSSGGHHPAAPQGHHPPPHHGGHSGHHADYNAPKREPRTKMHSSSVHVNPGVPVKKMISLYDYDPQELSPNVDSELELSFRTGDILYVFGEMDEDGFYVGELNGVRGLVPSNFLTEAPPDYRDNNVIPEHGGPPQGMMRDRSHPSHPPSGNVYPHGGGGGGGTVVKEYGPSNAPQDKSRYSSSTHKSSSSGYDKTHQYPTSSSHMNGGGAAGSGPLSGGGGGGGGGGSAQSKGQYAQQPRTSQRW